MNQAVWGELGRARLYSSAVHIRDSSDTKSIFGNSHNVDHPFFKDNFAFHFRKIANTLYKYKKCRI